MKINDKYNDFYSVFKDWTSFQSTPKELVESTETDYSITTEVPPEVQSLIFRIASIVKNCFVALYELPKKVIQRLIMTPLYPSQSSLVKLFFYHFRTSTLDDVRQKFGEAFGKQGYIIRHVTLEKNGRKHSGLLIGHKNHIQNKKWALYAGGNLRPMEYAAKFAKHFHEQQTNLLLVNNPGVGRSQGTATADSMGEAQELGIRYLEDAIKANKIILTGFSLGGAAMGKAILKHDFRKGIDYFVVRQMTFDRASNVCGQIGKLPGIATLVKWTDCEMDSVAASKKLQDLQIPETIIQGADSAGFLHDGMIPKEATLAYSVQKELGLKHKHIIGLNKADHCDMPWIGRITAREIEAWEAGLSLIARAKARLLHARSGLYQFETAAAS